MYTLFYGYKCLPMQVHKLFCMYDILSNSNIIFTNYTCTPLKKLGGYNVFDLSVSLTVLGFFCKSNSS